MAGAIPLTAILVLTVPLLVLKPVLKPGAAGERRAASAGGRPRRWERQR